MPTPVSPTGQTSTSPGLPADWQDKPTTPASLNAAVQIIDEFYGGAAAEDFQAWYQAAWAKDKNLTPNQAVAAWVAGSAIAKNLKAATGVLAKTPGAVAAAANTLPNVPNPLASFLNSTWPLRIGEILLGLVLVAVGVAKIVPAFTPAQMIAKRLGA